MRSCASQRLDHLAKASPGEDDGVYKKQRTERGAIDSYFARMVTATEDSVKKNSPAHNTRGKVKPILPSPDDVLTEDRDGAEMAKILVSPIR